MKNIILGAGIAGISASHELRQNNIPSIILEKNKSWGGLLDNFVIDGFLFDKFVHLSFAKDDYVNNIFFKTPFINHNPKPYNYFNGKWLKHPAQNNLYPLSENEKELIISDFKKRKKVDFSEINNFEEWLRVQYGDYFSEKFAMVYTEKYWTLKAKDMEVKWIGNKMYIPTLKEVQEGCINDTTPNTYYAKEMRYPQKGGYKSFLKPLIKNISILTDHKITGIDLNKRLIYTIKDKTFQYENLINSLPLPELCKLIKDLPKHVLAASEKLNFTSGYLISLGFNKPDIVDKLWFYIYDKDILPARVYSPSIKSPKNAPKGCSSIQAELYFNKGQKLNISNEKLLEQTIAKFIKIGLFEEKDIIVKDIRVEKYANVVFDHLIYENRKIVIDFLKQNKIITIGRFGEWDYFWSDQSMISGRNGAKKLIKMLNE